MTNRPCIIWGLCPLVVFFTKSEEWISFPLANFIWKSKAAPKVRAFARLVANKRVNTNDLLPQRMIYKALKPKQCVICLNGGESVYCLFLPYPTAVGVTESRTFRAAGLARHPWKGSRYNDHCFYGFGGNNRSRALFCAFSLALLWLIGWRKMLGSSWIQRLLECEMHCIPFFPICVNYSRILKSDSWV